MTEDLTKRFYVENPDSGKKPLSPKKFSDKQLEVKVVEHGIVLPARFLPAPNPGEKYEGGVCDNYFNFVAGFSRKDPAEKNFGGGYACVESSYVVSREEIIQIDEDVIFGGSLLGHFGHFILECWSRLWYVIQNPQLQSKVLFITTTHGGYKSWFDDFFRLMGIDKERIVYVKKPTQCRSVTVPEQSQYNSWTFVKFTKEFFVPYQAIKSRVTPGKIKKLYLTRRNVVIGNYRRVCCNEEYFEDFFTARGFKVIAPEKLSIEEQVSLIMGADEIAAIQGTLTHWAMFCKPDAKFIMLKRHDSTQDIQIFINEAFGVENYYIVDAWKKFMYVESHIDGVFMLGSNRCWREFVADYFGEQIKEDDDNSHLDVAVDNYIDIWCKKYADSKNRDKWIDSFKDLCHHIIALETEKSHNRPLLTYQTHVAKTGWGDGWKSENQLSNPLNKQLDIQAIKIDFPSHNVYYAVYYNEKEGWSEEVSAGQMAGTTGKAKAIMGIKIRLDETSSKEFDILYRVHKFDGEWTAWAKNGEAIYSQGIKLNAIQIKLASKFKEFSSSQQ